MIWPYKKPLPPVTYGFGPRLHPILGHRKHHNGVDWASAIGRKLFAVSKGKVTYAGPSTLKFKNGEPAGGGYIVRIRFKDAGKFYTATYMHLRKGSIKVRQGDSVIQGQLIAESGNTGESTGPHLHFEIQSGRFYTWNNTGRGYHDPITFIKARLDK
jgi:murein DD-endopeptidase MepM/ murein hydrolase activator NlpD